MKLTRRQFFSVSGAFLLGGCEAIAGNETINKVLRSAEGLNEQVFGSLAGERAVAREYPESAISKEFKANGNVRPADPDYVTEHTQGWPNWRLTVDGLVARPHKYTLGELRNLPSRTQVTRHDCVEGWSAIAKWQGVPLAVVLDRAHVAPEARYVIFHCADMDDGGIFYYESIALRDARHPQTMLAYRMNDRDLAVPHGAPLRLRVERQLGYKQAKYIHRLELAASFAHVGQGKGGYWEDQGYEWYAGI